MTDEAERRLADRIEFVQQSGRDENGAWIYVTLDEDARPVNAAGPFPSEVDAFLASVAEDSRDPEGVEAGWTHRVVPLFAPAT